MKKGNYKAMAKTTYFYLGRLDEALEFLQKLENSDHVTKSFESPPFASIYFCNRTATYQALGQITDVNAN
ncbi:hypothetical protein HanRHA438_Chr15g0705951 [Helianthus annuus]|uniref:Putative tetratricopeptide-like helical domain-containing protein n=1 Tax=Helianthus annuus TaxID=4232 RepID=A0A251UJL3_HELAN|nr:hypothetical protein HanXRQr2_Chr15g0693641 [Helianthus annuus]KAJ0451228.1 hypothetical protein HanHA300_Chr15g0565211 [Helianthus annuus]KAJ0455677.1 hypothetical protein HanIR_Chr15g0753881 [Helianthus annuus]KAJ0473097.1 hypothetical protein HanHA89_Chr15g0614491 [Helianthus annuus]KAJ0648700.1 hypothetical protein HanLR1_Chr15g0575861 [Helianthus annuus]